MLLHLIEAIIIKIFEMVVGKYDSNTNLVDAMEPTALDGDEKTKPKLAPMPLLAMSRLVTVVFFSMATAIRSAPLSPILLPPRSRVVTVMFFSKATAIRSAPW